MEESNWAEAKDYPILQHIHQTLLTGEEPVSIHPLPLPFIATHIFGVKTNVRPLPPRTGVLLATLPRPENPADE